MRTTSRIVIAILLGGAGTGLMMAQTMTLTGTYNWDSLDGIYDSPYTATINGVSEDVICDDFADEVSIGESWNVVNPPGLISSTSTSTGLFGSESSVGYQEVAWLAGQLGTTLSNPQTPAQVAMQADVSYAIWAVFDPTGVKNWLLQPSYNDTTTYDAVFGTTGLLAQAAGNYGSAPSATVYTPSGYTGAGNPGEPQEFIVVAPPPTSAAEAPAAATLGIDLLGLGALLFVFRHQRLAVH